MIVSKIHAKIGILKEGGKSLKLELSFSNIYFSEESILDGYDHNTLLLFSIPIFWVLTHIL